MCGIAGFISIDNANQSYKRELAEALLLGIEGRGEDACGVYTNNRIVKQKGSVADFLKKDKLPKRYGKITLLHSRASTQGEPKNNHNNHPIEGKKLVLVHNGIISSDKLKKYDYKGECDSEILISYLETYGIEKGIGKLVGSMSVAFCEKENPDTLYLYKDSTGLEIGYIANSNLIVFASDLDKIDVENDIFPHGIAKKGILFTIKPNPPYFETNTQPVKMAEYPKVKVIETGSNNYNYAGSAEAPHKCKKQMVCRYLFNWEVCYTCSNRYTSEDKSKFQKASKKEITFRLRNYKNFKESESATCNWSDLCLNVGTIKCVYCNRLKDFDQATLILTDQYHYDYHRKYWQDCKGGNNFRRGM